MKIIDIHAHIYPDDLAAKASASVKEFYDGIGDPNMDGTEGLLMRRAQEAGVDRIVTLPVALRPDRVRSINEYIYQRSRDNLKLIPFGAVHAEMEGLTEEVERLIDLGFQGIKIHPDSQRFAIDDPRLFPMYEAIKGRVPVMFHMGDLRYDYSHPERLRRVLGLFPEIDVIAAHLGGYSMYETALEFLRDKTCVLDISSSARFLEPGLPEKYINLYGAERIAFGSDYPMFDPVEEVANFLRLKLTDGQKEQIAHKTAERVLKL